MWALSLRPLTHGLTVAEAKGGWLATLHTFPSTMAQNFWIAIYAWTSCLLVTVLVSLVTKPKEEYELKNLVYGFTAKPSEEHLPWHQRPNVLAVLVGIVLIGLNLIFW